LKRTCHSLEVDVVYVELELLGVIPNNMHHIIPWKQNLMAFFLLVLDEKFNLFKMEQVKIGVAENTSSFQWTDGFVHNKGI